MEFNMYDVLTNRKIQEASEMEPKTPLRASCMVKWTSEADDMVAPFGLHRECIMLSSYKETRSGQRGHANWRMIGESWAKKENFGFSV